MAQLLNLCFFLTLFAVVLSDEREVSPLQQITNSLIQHQDEGEFRSKLQASLRGLEGASKEQQVAILNDYMDRLLGNLNRYLAANGVETLELPSFERTVGWSIFSAWVSLRNGKLRGLTTIDRRGDAVIKYQYPNINVIMPVGFNIIDFQYYFEVKVMYFGPAGNAFGSSRFSAFNLNLDLNLINLTAKLNDFNFDIGHPDVTFKPVLGSIPPPFIFNVILDVVLPILRSTISSTLEVFITSGLGTMLDTYNNFICTILNDCPSSFNGY